jgi:tetratricopeptide (TPR) repeat protein
MKPLSPSTEAAALRRPFERLGVAAIAVLFLAAAAAAWWNSFDGPFILDDVPAIVRNPTLRQLWPPGPVLATPGEGLTVSGRPLLNLSLALNWTAGGASVRGYHAVNLAIHALAALALFGVARRTLQTAPLAPRFAAGATAVALSLAGLWLLHPLQTESVTYVVQRAESLAGLFLLLTLYAAIRGAGSSVSGRWSVLAVAACLLGMATKEVMFAAPILVLLHDRTFTAGSFRAALRRRPRLYAGLAATWLLLGWLVWREGGRSGTAGFATGISSWHYLLTQCEAIVHYLKLAFWPSPLVLDYGVALVTSPAAVWPQLLLLLALFLATLFAIARRSAWGFLGAAFFLLLAPSSSVLPIATQTVAEHRMYLPLAAVIAAAVSLGWIAWGRRSLVLCAVAAVALGALTARRNTDYQSAVAIWRDTATKRPANARAHQELALALFGAGRLEEALPEFAIALRLQPGYPTGRFNHGLALAAAGRHAEAAAEFAEAIRLKPGMSEAHLGLGNELANLGHFAEAVPHLQKAVALNPTLALARQNLARALDSAGRTAEAVAVFQSLLADQPDHAEGHFLFANLLVRSGRLREAIAHFAAAARLAPENVAVRLNLGVALYQAGQKAAALRELETVMRLDPGNADALRKLEAVRHGAKL